MKKPNRDNSKKIIKTLIELIELGDLSSLWECPHCGKVFDHVEGWKHHFEKN